MMYKGGEIVLIKFPFTDLVNTKVRPALILTEKKNDVIVLGIFSKVPDSLDASWFLLEERMSCFTQTGLKKRSIIKTEKIAVIHSSIIKKKLGTLPDDIFMSVREKTRETLNI